MSDMYCVYNGKKYKIKKKNDKYIITSRVRKEDFINYIDVLGNEHSELFMKIVNANEVERWLDQCIDAVISKSLDTYALVEILSFGMLSKFYKNMHSVDKKEII